MLTLYICLGYLIAPLAFARELWRGFADRSHWRGLSERFGFGPRPAAHGLWVHAVSVGEVQAAVPLVRALKERYPELALTLTTSTATGRARAEHLFADRATVRYLPYDLPDAVARFLGRLQPQLGVMLETELWPNLYRGCARREIPLVLASARVSARSVARYRRAGALFTRTLATGVRVAAQTQVDAERFAELGADPAWIQLCGNLKFDFEVPPAVLAEGAALREALGATGPVWVAGSTHAGEEEILLEAHARLRARTPGALLVLVPRHPPRFEAVAGLLARRGVVFARRSLAAPVRPETSVLLIDTLGELLAFYAAGDVAFVGGSLVPIGGHNLLEPASLGRPVLTGPFTQNAPAISALLIAAGGLRVVKDANELEQWLATWCTDPAARERVGGKGRAVIAANRGALARVLALIAPLMQRESSR